MFVVEALFFLFLFCGFTSCFLAFREKVRAKRPVAIDQHFLFSKLGFPWRGDTGLGCGLYQTTCQRSHFPPCKGSSRVMELDPVKDIVI